MQVLGLCYYLTGKFGDAIPLLEETRAWADDNLELGHILGLVVHPDASAGSGARLAGADVSRPSGVRRRACDRGADDAQARDGAAGRGGAEARARKGRPHPSRATTCSDRSRSSGDAWTRRSRSAQKELAINPVRRDGALSARRRASSRVAHRRRGGRAPEVTVDQPVLQRPVRAARAGLHARRTSRRPPRACCGARIQYDPNNRAAHYLLAQLLQQIGRIEEAKQEFAIAERLQPPGPR